MITNSKVITNSTAFAVAGAMALIGTNYIDPVDRLQNETVIAASSAAGTRTVASPWDFLLADLAQDESRWRDYVTRRLAQLRRGEGDYTGLMQPTEKVIRRARGITESLFRPETPTPSVVPSEDGEVLFVWHKSGWALEIAVGLEEVSIWAHEASSGTAWSGSLAELRTHADDLLDLFARQ